MGEKADELRQKRKELEQHRQHERYLEEEISKLSKKVISESIAEKINAYELDKLEQPIGLNNLLIRDFLCFDKTAEDIKLNDVPILITGSSPWKKDEFEEFLSSKNFNCISSNATPDILILGSLEIDTEKIDQIIDTSISIESHLKIYTQELFVYKLITGEDPLKAWEETALLSAVEGHAGIEHILSIEAFQWPNLDKNYARDDYTISEINPADWSEDSPLSKLGYTVREGALSENQRHQILTRVFNESLARYLNGDNDVRIWGKPKSPRRLYAIAQFIKWLSSFQGGAKPAAANKWKNDLQWLKTQFYLPSMAFKWPNQRIEYKAKKKNVEIVESKLTNKPKSFRKIQYFEPGQKVYHEKFGWGRVTRRYIENNQVEVKFFNSDYGSKVFDRSIADFYQ